MAKFASLPPEIRAMIWGFCLPGPRTVMVKRLRHTRAPVVLHICRESRREARHQSYELAFPVPHDGGRWLTWHRLEFKGQPVIWFNFSLDRLCLESIFVNPDQCSENFRRVRSFGLTFPLGTTWDPFWDENPLDTRWFDIFPQLEEIAVFRDILGCLKRLVPSDLVDRIICASLGRIYSLPSLRRVWYRSYSEKGRFGDLTRPSQCETEISVYHRGIGST
ncbi:hypothetical protein F4805DRAFT_248235 [Annulohypoxylon moriforme]|nr:hypothetical protein F4805DRAFT_248235 [Annulohypoxylon moriforme]